MNELLYNEETYKIIGACFEVYKRMVEIKAISNLIDEHRAITLNYLNLSNLKVGLLVNFGHYPKLEYERFVL